MRKLSFVLGVILALCAASGHAQQTVVEVIPLHYRNADEIIPILRPLVAPGGTLSGLNNRLILRTTPANLAEIKHILAELDTAPRRLVISVRHDADLDRTRSGGQISGTVSGDDVTVTVPGRPMPPGAEVRVDGARAQVHSSRSQQTDQVSQRVQVLEGSPAFIRVGESFPVRPHRTIDPVTGYPIIDSAEYRDVDRGFYVLPRVSGDRVTLQISTAADTLRSPRTGVVDVQRVDTVVSGRLGEWIEVGAVGQQAVERDSEVLARSRDARRDARRVLLRVEEIR
jgi:hypothetical protein